MIMSRAWMHLILPTVTEAVAAPEKREHCTSKCNSLGPEGDKNVRKQPVNSEHNAREGAHVHLSINDCQEGRSYHNTSSV